MYDFLRFMEYYLESGNFTWHLIAFIIVAVTIAVMREKRRKK
jgi:hypothetical protein